MDEVVGDVQGQGPPSPPMTVWPQRRVWRTAVSWPTPLPELSTATWAPSPRNAASSSACTAWWTAPNFACLLAAFGVDVRSDDQRGAERTGERSGGQAHRSKAGDQYGVRAGDVRAAQCLVGRAEARGPTRPAALAKTFARPDRLTVALITVGAWQPGDSNLHDARALSVGDRDAATRCGAVAEFASHLVDATGHTVATELTDRCTVVPLQRLRDAREVVAIAAARRAPAVGAALRSGLVGLLIMDAEVADALIAHPAPRA
ncbi:sugar-binding domain-containing protein [Streptomyces daliensis]